MKKSLNPAVVVAVIVVIVVIIGGVLAMSLRDQSGPNHLADIKPGDAPKHAMVSGGGGASTTSNPGGQ
jgi:hypothetical protein